MTAPDYMDWDWGITTVEAGYITPGHACCHLVVDAGRAAFVETGTRYTVERLLAALARAGLDVDAVDWVVVTHVHLDHAGGAGALLRKLPNARLVVHPRGARHLIDPTRLEASARDVYGDAEFERLYGELVPVPADRVVVADDGYRVHLGEREWVCLDAPGHARHHLVVWDPAARVVFTGDAFGLSYRWADTERGPWMLPTTTPTQFDPEAMRATVRRIAELGARRAHLTHWGAVDAVPSRAEALLNLLDEMVEMALRLQDAPDRTARLEEALRALYLERLRVHGCRLPEDELVERLRVDVQLNAQGLSVWLDRRARSGA